MAQKPCRVRPGNSAPRQGCTRCYNHSVGNPVSARTFKTAWFARAARKAHITEEELCARIRQVIAGQADDLGAGVYKKRMRNNQYRSIILSGAGQFWVYEYLFAKQDRANIEDDELAEFRKLAKLYAGLSTQQINQLLRNRDWVEICNDNQA